jgi:hypothetical protein
MCMDDASLVHPRSRCEQIASLTDRWTRVTSNAHQITGFTQAHRAVEWACSIFDRTAPVVALRESDLT